MLKRNLLANFLGKGWVAIIQLIFVPYYARLLGVEAYGLVGLFGLLTTLGFLFDTGLSSSLNRELARFLALNSPAKAFRDLVRTTELVNWAMGLVLGGLIVLFSPWIAARWLNVKLLDMQVVNYSIALMGLYFAFQFPLSIYQNGLQGLQKHQSMNLLSAILVTFRMVGAVAVLVYFNSSPVLFFAWQTCLSLVHTLAMRYLLWKGVPKSADRASFDKRYLLEGRKFMGGITILTMIAILITSLDKIMLSKLMSLEDFGYYSVAANVANGLWVVIAPIFSSVYPAYSSAVARNDEIEQTNLYHKSTQIMSIFIFPLTLVLAFFAFEIMFLWTGNVAIATNTSGAMVFLAIGTGIGGILHVPGALQLAHGWLKLSFYQNSLLLIAMAAFLPHMIKLWGAIGAAVLWMLVNFVMLCTTGYFLHRKYLIGERMHWYLQDICLPAASSLAVVALGKWCFSSDIGKLATLFYLILLTGITFVVALLVTPFPRNWVLEKLRMIRTWIGTT